MTDVRSDWENRIGRPSGEIADGTDVTLPVPRGLRAAPGRGQVTLSWDPVDGAAGYLVGVASGPDGPFVPLDHGGRDVLAVPHGPYVDTSSASDQRWYSVAAVVDVDRIGSWSVPIAAGDDPTDGGAVNVIVDAAKVIGDLQRPWRPMIGSEHLSHMLCTDRTGGRQIGIELQEALRAAHDVLGVHTVRAHAILCDDLGVYREIGGQPVYDFAGVDRVYDTVCELGLRPVVELSFMPRDLAVDPAKTVFEYQAIVSPPKDWERWRELVRNLADHLVGDTGAPTCGIAGRSRCGTSPTWRCSGLAPRRSTSGSTTSRRRRSGQSTPHCRSAVQHRRLPDGLSRRSAMPTRTVRRWTSSQPTRTGARRSICDRCWSATAGRGPRCGGPSGG